MKAVKYDRWIVFLFLILLAACHKSDEADKPDSGGGKALGIGTIYYEWAIEGILNIDLQTGTKSIVLPSRTALNGWDVSLDGKWLLRSADDADDYDAEVYTIINLSDGTVVKKFQKATGYANHTSPSFSPDATLIAAPPTYDDGLIILNLEGKILHNLRSYQGEKIGQTLVWMPDNTILFSAGNNLYRTDKMFQRATLIRRLDFDDWKDVTISRDGSKIALSGGNHIWMMNADGTGMVQVTKSNAQEALPVFSPDGKYLLIGTDYHTTGPFGHLWYLSIVPADGKPSNVNIGADPRVIPVMANGETMAEAADGNMLWR